MVETEGVEPSSEKKPLKTYYKLSRCLFFFEVSPSTAPSKFGSFVFALFSRSKKKTELSWLVYTLKKWPRCTFWDASLSKRVSV